MTPLLRTICAILCILIAVPLTFACPTKAGVSKQANKRPTYAIAHMVLDRKGLKDAIKNGANSVEIDIAAYKEGWWADHDIRGRSWGDSLEDMFKAVAKESKNIAFVWLDLKTPDMCSGATCNKDVLDPSKCKPKDKCSMNSLQELAQKILNPAGVRILYGFFGAGATDSAGFNYIQGNLKAGEAVCLSGEVENVLNVYKKKGRGVKPQQRVMDYGYTQLETGFGNCKEKGYNTCAGLRNGAKARDKGDVKRVFGWTSRVGDGERVGQLLDKAHVDGIIYGFAITRYYDHEDSRAAARDITQRVQKSDDRYMATGADKPW
ncbi:phospholipase D [Histoplasma capsulatum G186AR]|uniref:Sphingomyelinase D n=1 Tax=Ajellomyces capsulatus (strain G186AR / H82 / ATCC MYA-2454 / RMSCC 2432) TaxID=447093 RepID=SMD_AJECG|nr:phospholipase D [Histoplasma capsulatum G186AR]C0NUU1.1 RecName: Full=Sphingomyelinase D; Short=SMase D; Flags: Precursor [Histoplasma capsulatum G186AR]EEH04754.1 phospholipase D [Histoplasma capsulatum G186AR]